MPSILDDFSGGLSNWSVYRSPGTSASTSLDTLRNTIPVSADAYANVREIFRRAYVNSGDTWTTTVHYSVVEQGYSLITQVLVGFLILKVSGTPANIHVHVATIPENHPDLTAYGNPVGPAITPFNSAGTIQISSDGLGNLTFIYGGTSYPVPGALEPNTDYKVALGTFSATKNVLSTDIIVDFDDFTLSGDNLVFFDLAEVFLATEFSLEITAQTTAPMDPQYAVVNIASVIGLEITAEQEIDEATLGLSLIYGVKIDANTNNFIDLEINSTFALQINCIFVKQVTLEVYTDIAIELTATMPLAATLNIASIWSNRLTVGLAPTATLLTGTIYACEINCYKAQSVEIHIATEFSSSITVGCGLLCGDCNVPSYSSLGVY